MILVNLLYSRKFLRVQFSWMGDRITFCSSIFADVHYHAITSTHKHAYFVGLIFTVHESTVKTMEIGSHLENFLLYGNLV